MLAPLTAGFVCVLVGFTSSYPIVVAAADAMGMSRDQIVTLTLALAVAMGLTTMLPSLWLRIPVVTAWSTPGAALLVTSVEDVALGDAIGAFVVCGVLLTLAGATGWFARSMQRLPVALASALLAGVLVRFGMGAFAALETAFTVVAPMLAAWLVLRRLVPRYCIALVLLTGVAAASLTGALAPVSLAPLPPMPVPITPSFDWSAIVGVSVPLFVVTMASQNLPGVATLHASGYRAAPVSTLVALTGATTLVLAPFGVFAVNLAAITAAICMGEEAHPDPAKRWQAAVCAGLFYLLVAAGSASIVDLFSALPRELVATVAGLALLPTIGRGLAVALGEERERDAALVTFLVTASGLTLLGIGSAFWAVVAGVVVRLGVPQR
ncbi:MAG: benzoate/H(+) symporter BenE family transporter [Ectothiorhodospiraceae bacterium]|nr:benzoate/H(+) symporter BenE family transporter [Ectothiorhodospiraceae bacterium]